MINCLFILLLDSINIGLSLSIKLAYLLIDKLQLLNFSFNIQVLVLFALNREFEIVNHLFVLSYRER